MIEKLEIARLLVDDYQEMLVAMKASYPKWSGSYWSMGAISNLIKMFPEGQMVVRSMASSWLCIVDNCRLRAV